MDAIKDSMQRAFGNHVSEPRTVFTVTLPDKEAAVEALGLINHTIPKNEGSSYNADLLPKTQLAASDPSKLEISIPEGQMEVATDILSKYESELQALMNPQTSVSKCSASAMTPPPDKAAQL